jgi:hypothetical protein
VRFIFADAASLPGSLEARSHRRFWQTHGHEQTDRLFLRQIKFLRGGHEFITCDGKPQAARGAIARTTAEKFLSLAAKSMTRRRRAWLNRRTSDARRREKSAK